MLFIAKKEGPVPFFIVLILVLLLFLMGAYFLFKSFSVYQELEKLQKNGIRTEGMFKIIGITQRYDAFAATLSGEIINPVTGKTQVVKSNRFGGINWGNPASRWDPYGRDDIRDIKKLLEKPFDVYFSNNGENYIVNIAPVYRLLLEKNKYKWKFMSKSMYLGFGVIIFMYVSMFVLILFFIK